MKSVNIMKSVKLFLSNLAIVALVLVLSNCGGGETPTPDPANVIAGRKLVGTWNVTGVKYSATASGTVASRDDAIATAVKGISLNVTASGNGGGITLNNVPPALPLSAIVAATWTFNDAVTVITWGGASIPIPGAFISADDTTTPDLVVSFTITDPDAVSARTLGVFGKWELTIKKQ